MNCGNCGTMLGTHDRACAVCGSRSKPPEPKSDEIPVAEETGDVEPPTGESRPPAAATGPDTELRNKKLAREPEDLSKEHMLARAAQVRFRGAARPAVGQMILLAKLGQGGMGVVYFGVHPRLGTEVAVKVLAVQGPSASDPQHVARFLREARLAASLRSEHLVGVLDVNHDDEAGLHYIVMEYVRGVAAIKWLESFQKTRTKVPEALALDLVIAATKGLAAAHENGIVHRDVKPDNILLPLGPDGTPAVGRAKLADLGLARSERGGDTVTGAPGTMGSPGFMAPEQVDGRVPITRAADVFGMGATLHALLAGKSPFSGGTPLQTIVRTVQNQCEPIGMLRPDVSPQTAAVIARCLDPKPERRYPEAGALLTALESARRLVEMPKAQPEPKTGDEELATKSLVQMSPAELAAAHGAHTAHAPFAGTPVPDRGGTILTPPSAPPMPVAETPRKRAPVALLAVVGVVVIGGVVAAVVLSGKGTDVASAPPRASTAPAPKPPDPVVVKPEPAPVPVVPPRDLEAERRAEEDKKARDAERTKWRFEDADRAVAQHDFEKALTVLLSLRADREIRPELLAKIDAVVQKALEEARTASDHGDLEGAEARLSALQRIATRDNPPALTRDNSYFADEVAADLDRIRAARGVATKAKEDLASGDAELAKGKFDAAIRAYRRVPPKSRQSEDAEKGIAEAVRLAARRGRERDAAGEHLGAIDDFDLVLKEREAVQQDGVVDRTSVTLDLADAAIAIGEYKRAEAALARLSTSDAVLARAVVLRGKLGLALGGETWRDADRNAINALPDDARGRLAEDTLVRGEAALTRREFDEALLDGRVAAILNPLSTRPTFLIGAASAGRAVSDRRRPKDLTNARTFLALTIKEVERAGAGASADLRALGVRAQQLLDGLPK